MQSGLIALQRVERHLIESLDDIELPSREAHTVQLLEGQDVLWLDWTRAVWTHRAADAPKRVP